MSCASSSTASLVSNTTVSSRTPLTAMQPKDFQAAFASLQSTNGFAGSAPMPVPKSNAPRSTVSSASTTTASSHAPSTAPKGFQSAFADLQSTYGFGGAAPSPVPKPKKEGSSCSFFSKLVRSAKPRTSTPSSPSTSTPKTKVRFVPRPTPHMTLL
ncbi:hypothetical protein DFH07DRAFT_392646 [Mycena maculata]|uniref:Uncharacterized protein n=1 Tax=Mycena maculata TaxID=230809 RepID=A0AAD7KAX5_9AGAR|nr:hypothetical protein DFH07DRAFT_392646 [Mycena maculata]